jgi:hypothetical protein
MRLSYVGPLKLVSTSCFRKATSCWWYNINISFLWKASKQCRPVRPFSSIIRGCMTHSWSIFDKLEAKLIQNSNVCKDFSPCKLSNILKNLFHVVKWRPINLLTVLLLTSCICFLSVFSHINCIGGVFVLLSS